VLALLVGGAAIVGVYRWTRPSDSAATSSGAPAAAGGSGGGADSAARASASPSAAGTGPATSGVFFDDFHYTGAGDPALGAHGWTVRTGSGNPGIPDSWSAAGVSFPAVQDAQGGRVLQLQAHTDGTRAGTRQSELTTEVPRFADGTYAARVYFTTGPVSGQNGDHISEAFYAISPPTSAAYSELDFEYQPNGGWGSPLPELDTTSWRSSTPGDRVYHALHQHLHGWHTLRIVVQHGTAAYYLDDTELFTSASPYALHGPVDVAFSTWLIDLPFTGQRTWNVQVNWFYFQAGKAVSRSGVEQAVDGYYAGSTHYVNSLK